MTGKRRLITLVICSLLGLMLLLYAGHAAQHRHDHSHVHQGCEACRVMDGWFSMLRGAAGADQPAEPALAAMILALALGAVSFALRQDITPVTLKVKISS